MERQKKYQEDIFTFKRNLNSAIILRYTLQPSIIGKSPEKLTVPSLGPPKTEQLSVANPFLAPLASLPKLPRQSLRAKKERRRHLQAASFTSGIGWWGPAPPSVVFLYYLMPWIMINTGALTKETTETSLIRMFMVGPEVSLKGSPTVSPTTAAL